MDKKTEQLGSRSIPKLLVKFSTPAIAAMTLNGLYNVVDTIVVGKGVGTGAVAGLAICFPVQMLNLALGQTIGIGAASIVSRSMGAKNYDKADKTAGTAFVSAVLLGLLISILGQIFVNPILRVFGASNDILPFARAYMKIIFIGVPFFAASVSGNNLVRSEGSPFIAMLSMMTGTIINIILDPIFVFAFHMGVKGAALATIIAQMSSFTFLSIYFFTGKSILRVKINKLKIDFAIFLEIISVGIASFVRQAAGSIVSAVLNHSIGVYGGDLYIAIFGIVNKILTFTFMPMFGIVQGLQPIIGFNYGAKKFDRVKKALLISMSFVTILACIDFTVLEIFPSFIMGIFSNDKQLIREGAPVLRIIVSMVPIVGIQIIGASYFQSIGKVVPAMVLTMTRQILFLLPLIIVLPIFMKLIGVWMSFPISDILSTALTVIFIIREMSKMKSLS